MKAQVASETLMVYAFVFIAVLVAVMALSYTGIRNPKMVPEKCFSQGLTCVDKPSVRGSNISLALKNSLPGDVTINGLSTDICTVSEQYAQTDTVWVNLDSSFLPVPKNEVARVKIVCDSELERVKGSVTMHYTNTESGISNHVVAEVNGRAS